ncbi:hydrolase [Aeromicrobium flavum]|uniref:Hydrolase n=1 Tax=Aeromicrobium flavum TaxID=416568 RepID=A0A512HY35_9ACTN|nr:amidohydrolase family protein [Aeromicrobium flavum]GEO90361.1 hydrolase [Aeromicrobium flavum]
MSSLLLRHVRLVPIRTAAPTEPVSVRIVDGTIVAVAPEISPERGDEVVEADGRWAAPGLWDQHVHLTQWAQTRTRLDVSGTTDPTQVTALVGEQLRTHPDDDWVFGYGFRLTEWERPPTVAELDAVSGGRPVVLTSGDAHTGWLNTAALAALGAEPTDGPVTEAPWFTLMTQVVELTSTQDGGSGIDEAIAEAAGRGVVGLVDFEFAEPLRTWPERVARGIDAVAVRRAVYPDYLDEVIAAGLRTGDPLTPDGLVTMGPLKIISDGSLNTRTAFCHEPYAGSSDRGVQNHDRAALAALLERATAHGLAAAVHAIGDAAVHEALAAFAGSGATGSIEHAQLMAPADIATMAALGVTASVQPAHLLDDRDVAARLWPDREQDCFPLRSLLDAGVTVTFGSDAPVSALDPWTAMAAAVHRSDDAREPWNPAQAMTPAEALAASVDGRDTLSPGRRADLVLLDRDPLPATDDSSVAAARLREVGAEATLRAGRFTHARSGLRG